VQIKKCEKAFFDLIWKRKVWSAWTWCGVHILERTCWKLLSSA